MLKISNAEASANILSFADEGRLTQGQWHNSSGDGRDIACLLGSIHPSVTSAAECNGALMPMWLAELTPVLFDGIPADSVYPFAKRYGVLIGHWHILDDTAWNRVLTKVLIKCIDDAVDAAQPVASDKPYWPAVNDACTQSKAALTSGNDEKAEAAAEAAAWAARAAAEAARAAAEAAAWAARAAARAAAWAARAAARAAAWAAAEAARAAADAAAWAAEATADAARAAAWAAYLRLATFLLDQIEAELERS